MFLSDETRCQLFAVQQLETKFSLPEKKGDRNKKTEDAFEFFEYKVAADDDGATGLRNAEGNGNFKSNS